MTLLWEGFPVTCAEVLVCYAFDGGGGFSS